MVEVCWFMEFGVWEVYWDGCFVDVDYVIMEDLEGNCFCIVDCLDWVGWDGGC